MIDFDLRWSQEGSALVSGTLAGFVAKFAGKDDVVTMHVGLPPDSTFALKSLAATASNGDRIEINDSSKMSIAQQYIFSGGYPGLVQWAKGIVDKYHKPQVPVEVVVTAGSVHAVSNLISCLADRGDTLIVDEFTYAHVSECIFLPRGLKLLPIRMDDGGMDPQNLDEQLQQAAETARCNGTKPPRLMYIIPVAQNPTGVTLSVERKEKIYQVCQKHDIAIMEDDAYYWLQFYPKGEQYGTSSDVPGLDVDPSFLSIDTDGRVIRIDTMAKLMGPGYRIGWVTCTPKLAQKLIMAIQGNCCGANSLSMVLLHEVIKTWGESSFEEFIKSTQRLYRSKAEAAVKACEQHLKGLAEFIVPKGGMFMWVRFLDGIKDFDEELEAQLVEHKVVGVPGRLFWSEVSKAKSGAPCPYMRISFGSLLDDQIVEGIQRLGCALQSVKDKKIH
jgi:kynurenine/2-aminoadipate aminotransferase